MNAAGLSNLAHAGKNVNVALVIVALKTAAQTLYVALQIIGGKGQKTSV